jgi:hypothetical protein
MKFSTGSPLGKDIQTDEIAANAVTSAKLANEVSSKLGAAIKGSTSNTSYVSMGSVSFSLGDLSTEALIHIKGFSFQPAANGYLKFEIDDGTNQVSFNTEGLAYDPAQRYSISISQDGSSDTDAKWVIEVHRTGGTTFSCTTSSGSLSASDWITKAFDLNIYAKHSSGANTNYVDLVVEVFDS